MNRVGNIPKHAETKFLEMCASSGVVCNPSLEDKKGWDFIIQFDSSHVETIPIDMRQNTEPSFVQIKSVFGRQPRIKVKLSNALEFSKNSLPCFIIVFRYDTNGNIDDSVFFLHFWTKEILRTLRRVRELEAKGISSLNKHYLTFSLSSMEITTFDMALEKIKNSIKAVGNNYQIRKRSIDNSIGFGDKAGIATICFDSADSIKRISDAMLGLDNSIPFSGVEIQNRRFGIDLPLPGIEGGGTIEISPTPRPSTVVVFSTYYNKRVSLGGDFFFSRISATGKAEGRFLFRSAFLSVTHDFGTERTEVSLCYENDKSLRFLELKDLFDLISILSFGEAEATFYVDQERLCSSYITTTKNHHSKNFRILSSFFGIALDNMAIYDIPQNFLVSPKRLLGKIDDITEIVNILSDDELELTMKMKDVVSFERQIGVAIFGIAISIIDYFLCFIVNKNAEIKFTGGTAISTTLFDTISISTTIFQDSEIDIEQQIMDRISDISERCEEKVVCSFFLDFRETD